MNKRTASEAFMGMGPVVERSVTIVTVIVASIVVLLKLFPENSVEETFKTPTTPTLDEWRAKYPLPTIDP